MKLYSVYKINLPNKAMILHKLDGLREGEGMLISDKNDPYILYHQWLKEGQGDIFREDRKSGS